MFTINDLLNLTNNDGATLKKGERVEYKSGYQVAVEGLETSDAEKAMEYIKAYNGDAGVWFSEGIYYIDKSHRVSTKKKAIEEGKKYNQQSILKWQDKSLVWL